MRIAISAVGKLKDAEERAIVERYAKRFDGAGKSLASAPSKFANSPKAARPAPTSANAMKPRAC